MIGWGQGRTLEWSLGFWFEWVGSRSFTETGNRRGDGFAEKSVEPGLTCVELEMPRYSEMKRPTGLLYRFKSEGAACTINVKLSILISPPSSWKPLTPLRPLPSGYTAPSPISILCWPPFLIQGRLPILDVGLSSNQLIFDVLSVQIGSSSHTLFGQFLTSSPLVVSLPYLSHYKTRYHQELYHLWNHLLKIPTL